jgi:sulfite reductase (ferredoxin)
MNLSLQNTAGDVRRKGALDLHGTIQDELTAVDSGFSSSNVRLLKHHGVFQQDNRDLRHRPGRSRRYEFMVRVRTTGGKLSAWQLRSLLDLADELGDSNLHVTSRQGIQLAGIEKTALRPVMRYISDLGLTTSGTGGNFCCNNFS